MTDLELIDKYSEECRDFISPFLLREIEKRGLYPFINRTSPNVAEAKAISRARLAAAGRFYNDPEIDEIAGKIHRLNDLRKQLLAGNMADAAAVLPVLEEMRDLTFAILNYYK